MFSIFSKFIILLFASIIISVIPVNHAYTPDPVGIEIYIASNGVHTDYVLPVKTSIMDWQTLFAADQFQKRWSYAPYIAFGWGDRGFYLNTPEWKDLKLSTAMNALFIPSTSAMHVSLWPTPVEDDLTVKVRLNEEEYQLLVTYIMDSFKWGSDNQVIKIDHPGYGDFDLFFESNRFQHVTRQN